MGASGLPIDEWIQGLAKLPDGDDYFERVTRYVRTHLVDRASLEPYALFDESKYTRNLIFKNELFEVMALCWMPGQISRLHNHRDQYCWMVMAEGQLENVTYKVHDQDPAAGTCRVEPSTSTLITRERPMAVDLVEPVHQITNCPSANCRALSVHIYSKPFDTCEVYDSVAGTYRDVELSYDSEFGK